MIFRDILDQVEEIVNDKRFRKQLGDRIARIIYVRTKLGYGVNDDTISSPVRQRLAKLTSEEYIRRRMQTRLGKFGAPRRSNLTFTGKMLDAIESKVTKDGVEVFINDKPRGDGKTNAEVEEKVREVRPFFALTAPEQRIVNQFIDSHIRREIKKRFG